MAVNTKRARKSSKIWMSWKKKSRRETKLPASFRSSDEEEEEEKEVRLLEVAVELIMVFNFG